ncbi:hypothetical protein F997_02367 [Acinetobacter calcoaceticus NIPH 13]|nr:hypothetical protein F997_02367 [Acinetobacter calcoaceticus NIPH 13]
MFDTKIALIVRNDLATWQRLNVVAFLATGIASAVSEMLGKPYIDANGYEYGNMLGQPMLVFEGDLSGLQKAHRKGIEQELTIIPSVHAEQQGAPELHLPSVEHFYIHQHLKTPRRYRPSF